MKKMINDFPTIYKMTQKNFESVYNHVKFLFTYGNNFVILGTTLNDRICKVDL